MIFSQQVYIPQNLSINSVSASNINKTKNNFDIDSHKYLLDSGDYILVELKGISELRANVLIEPDGYINLPEIDSVYVRGLTIEELKVLLNKKYKKYVITPNVEVRITNYRPVEVFVHGEVVRPGLYVVKAQTPITSITNVSENILGPQSGGQFKNPTIFDAIRFTKGITPFTDLSNIEVTRKNSVSNGGGYIRAKVNLLSLMLNGDQSQNIRMFDDDVIKVNKSESNTNEQILKILKSNLNFDKVTIYMSGQVEVSGRVELDVGTSLNQAIASSGGKKFLSGDIQFIRFTKEGKISKRKFRYNPGALPGSDENPLLLTGDIINVKRSAIGYTTDTLSVITTPIVGIYSLLNVLEDF